MSDDKKRKFLEETSDNDLASDSDNLDLNSFVKKNRSKEKEPKNIFEKVLAKCKKIFKKIKKRLKKKGKRSIWQTILTAALVFMLVFSIALAGFIIYIFAFVDDTVQENLHYLPHIWS